MSYWDITDRIMRSGSTPSCPYCGIEMVAEDDHGRFKCFSCSQGGSFDAVLGTSLQKPPAIPQVDTSGMSDEQKAKIPPINRLDATPTAEETELLRQLLKPQEWMISDEALDKALQEPVKKEDE